MARGRDEERAEKEMKKKRVVLARRNDDAGRVELLAATQVGRPGLQDCAVDIIESDRPRAQYYLSFAIAFRGPDP